MLERIKHEKTVDIYGHVTCLRAQRNYMVQTEDQYIFIHDALLEAVTCGNTEVPARSLSGHIQKLMQPESGEAVTGMELEFKVKNRILTLQRQSRLQRTTFTNTFSLFAEKIRLDISYESSGRQTIQTKHQVIFSWKEKSKN